MIKVGLTGNIGSGKSTVCQIFNLLGAPVFHADAEAKKMYERPQVREAVRSLLGDKVFHPNGELNRKAVAEIVFQNKALLEKLNGIIHPEVRRRFIEFCDHHKNSPYVIQEAAILFESGFYKYFDKLITVAADKEIRIKRIMIRDKTEREHILKRMEHQMPGEEKVSKSDFVIRNNGSEAVIPQVLAIHRILSQAE